jgi:D-lactate dehydrogenase
VYFPACISTVFGPADGGGGVSDAFLTLCDRAGVTVGVPEGIAGLCCGTPWKSKGLTAGHAVMRQRVDPVVQAATRNGTLPLVVDASSCTEGLRAMLDPALRPAVVDVVEFVEAAVLPRLEAVRRLPSLVVHPTCSSTRAGGNAAMLRLASAMAVEVVVPDDWGCCGFAGDRGLLHPELTASATAAEAQAVGTQAASAYVSANRTCEMALSRATGRSYRHVIEVLEELSRPL